MLFQRQRPMRFFGLVILSFAVTALWRPGIAPIETARSFFGVHKVAEIADGSARLLYHGTTIHGAQRLRNDDGTPVTGPPAPQTYYYPGGPFAEAIGAARAARGSLDRVAVVGLGTGTLACHRKGGEHLDLLRDRSRSDPHRAGSASLRVPVALRARGAGRDRRCAPDAGSIDRPL